MQQQNTMMQAHAQATPLSVVRREEVLSAIATLATMKMTTCLAPHRFPLQMVKRARAPLDGDDWLLRNQTQRLPGDGRSGRRSGAPFQRQ